MKIFYNLGLYLIAIASFLRKRSRKAFLARLGKGFPRIEKKGRPLIWIHVVSVGETKAIAPLVKQLKELSSHPLILISSVTSTGHEEAKRSMPTADWHVFLPFDFSWLIKPIVKAVQPNLVILTETDFWHTFETTAKEVGASIVVVNGKLSERSFQRYLRFPSFAKLLLHPVDLFCVQDALYAKRFSRLGIASDKMVITGNIKLDGLVDHRSQEGRSKWGLTNEDLVFTCGSTHDPEEKILISALHDLWEKFPQLKVLLVPRHPERFDRVADFLDKEKIAYGRLSKKEDFSQKKVLLVDAMGVLRSCYQISDLAFVGGTFASKVGGHNILEPSSYGVPVLFGPYMYSQPQFLELARSYGAGIQVSEQTLSQEIEQLLSHSDKRQEIGKKGLQLVQEASGATKATFNEIKRFLQPC